MLAQSITVTADNDLIFNLIEESEELDRQECPDFIVYTLRHPVEGVLSLVKGALTDYAVITKTEE